MKFLLVPSERWRGIMDIRVATDDLIVYAGTGQNETLIASVYVKANNVDLVLKNTTIKRSDVYDTLDKAIEAREETLREYIRKFMAIYNKDTSRVQELAEGISSNKLKVRS